MQRKIGKEHNEKGRKDTGRKKQTEGSQGRKRS